MTKNNFSFFFHSSLLLLLYACAQVVSPSGGEKDLASPKVVEAKPENNSNYFESKEIKLQFDEFVQLKQLNQQLIVSPPLKKNPKTQLKGKSLILEIEDTLKANTTYVMNFGDAIVDITESNPLRNFQYVFSTGKFIDSLELSGQVVDAFSLEAEKEALVMLYHQTDQDSLAYNYLPSYLDRTDEEGRFRLTNIAEGDYKILALKDANSNQLFDRADEKIAFEKEIVHFPIEKDQLRLFTFTETSKRQFVDKEIWKNNQLILAFKNPVSSLQFSFLDTNTSKMLIDYRINSRKDSAFFWFKELDNRRLRFCVKDASSSLNDTLNLDFDSISPLRPLKLMSPLNKKLPYFNALSIEFNRPLDIVYPKMINLTKSDGSPVEFSIQSDTIFKNKAWIVFDQKPDSNYTLEFLPNAFTDVYGRELKDTIRRKINFNSMRDYGTLEVQVEMPEMSAPIFIQLTDTKGKVLRSESLTDNKLKYTYLKAGNYSLKLIMDNNNNGEWDTGNYGEETQPEKIFIYNENIQIRSNWDKEIKWIIR